MTTSINYNMGMDGLIKYGQYGDYGVVVNNYTFIFVPYAFGFDYANGNSDNRQRLDECISEVSKILIKIGFTQVTTTKDGTAVKAKKFDENGNIEKYWKVSIFRDTFEEPKSVDETPFTPTTLERTDTVFVPFTPTKLERTDTVFEPHVPFPPTTLERSETVFEPPVPFPQTKLERSDTVSHSPFPKKLERFETVSHSPFPTKPPGLQRQTTSNANVALMRHSCITGDGRVPVWNQKTVAFDDSATKQPIKYEGEPHGLVLNVWRLTGEGFDFYDMFEVFKEDVLKWK